jgi:ABC-type phosphate transport system substrate-binding protein
MKTTLHKLISSAILMTFAALANAEIAVIVNPANADKITKDDIQKLYLAKTKTFPGGGNATPIDQTEGAAIRVEFISKVIDKDEAQMKAYWSRLIFTGKGVPPKVVANDAEVKAIVKKDPSAIGFIDVISVDDGVKVVSTF